MMMMVGPLGEATREAALRANCTGFRKHESIQYSQIQCLLYV